MERRQLGQSEIWVSPIALGTWTMNGNHGSLGSADDNECIAAIHEALDCGVNLIGTAVLDDEGHSEKIVGFAIRDRRDEAVVAVTCGVSMAPKGERLVPDPRKESIIRCCEQSLRRMQIETIDLLQCHGPDSRTNLSETLEAMDRLARQGKIRAIGVSNFGHEHIMAARKQVALASLQTEFSLLRRGASDALIPYCREYGLAVLAYSPLAKGLLTGKLSTETEFVGIRTNDPDFRGERYARNLAAVAALEQIAANYGKTIAQLALNWVAQHDGVTSAIVGAKRTSQVRECIEALGWRIQPADLQRIAQIVGSL